LLFAFFYQDRLVVGLLMLTLGILMSLFLYDMGTDPTAWWGKIAAMTASQWFTAGFLTLGIVTSLGLIFSPRYDPSTHPSFNIYSHHDPTSIVLAALSYLQP
jgi:hypothetical protein